MKTFQFCTYESWNQLPPAKKGGEFGPLKKQKNKIFTAPFIQICHSRNLTSPIATSPDCAGQDVHTT